MTMIYDTHWPFRRAQPDIIITKTGLNRFGPMFILFLFFKNRRAILTKWMGLYPRGRRERWLISHSSFAHNRPIYGKRVCKYWIQTNTVFLREVWVTRYDVWATWCSLLSVQHQPLSLFLSLPLYYLWGFVSLWTIPLLPFSPWMPSHVQVRCTTFGARLRWKTYLMSPNKKLKAAK